MNGGGETLSRRIDKWLWCACRFKTLSIAAKFVTEASVRVTRSGVTQRIDKAGFLLSEGDEISYMADERLVVLTVTGFAERRGSPAAARRLFADRGKSANANLPPPCKAAG